MILTKVFLKNTLKIMIPIAIQNLVFSSLNMVDTLMIGQLGETSIAGVSLANQFFFILTLIYFGIAGGSTVFTSQYWGAKQIDKILNVFGISIKLIIIAGSFFSILGFFTPVFVISLFTNDSNVIKLGASYLKVVSICYLFSGMSFLITGILRSVGEVKLPLLISTISLLLNTLINYLLIFGSFGFPKLGILGAAIATLISRTVEFIIIIIILKRKKHLLLQIKRQHFKLTEDLKKKYYNTVLPVVVNEGLWATGTAAYSAIYARIGTASVAAYQIQQTVTTVFLIFVFGIGNTSAILIGNKIGSGDTKETYSYGKGFIYIGIFLGLITGVIIYLLAPYLIQLFKVDDMVLYTTKNLIKLFSIILVFKSLNITLVVGVLRGGGDTKIGMLMDIVGVWGIGVPLGIFSAFILKQPIEYVFIFISLEEIIKAIYGVYRFKSKKWIHNLSV